ISFPTNTHVETSFLHPLVSPPARLLASRLGSRPPGPLGLRPRFLILFQHTPMSKRFNCDRCGRETPRDWSESTDRTTWDDKKITWHATWKVCIQDDNEQDHDVDLCRDCLYHVFTCL